MLAMSFPFQIFHTRKHASKLILNEQKSEHKIDKFLQNELLIKQFVLSASIYSHELDSLVCITKTRIQRRLPMKYNQTGD